MCIFEAAPIAGTQPTNLPTPSRFVQLSSMSLQLASVWHPSLAVCGPCRNAVAAELHEEPAEAGTTGLQLKTGYSTVGSG